MLQGDFSFEVLQGFRVQSDSRWVVNALAL